MVTDPPYGVEYTAKWRHDAGLNNSKAVAELRHDDRADWRDAWALFHGDVAYVWHGALKTHVVADSLVASEFDLRSQIIWAKPRFVISRGHYHWGHESCWFSVRHGKTANWQGRRDQTTLWSVAPRRTTEDALGRHPTQKPVELYRRAIVNHTVPGDSVYDPFCGSGTILVACETERRVALAIELGPEWCDAAVQRWQRLTGESAILDATGQSFDDVVAARSEALRPAE